MEKHYLCICMRKFFLICLFFSFILSCKKNTKDPEVDNETQSAVDNAIAEQEFMGIVPTTNNHTIKTKSAGGTFKIGSALTTCDTLVKISGDTLWFTMPGQSSGPPTFTLAMNNSTCNPMPEGSGGRYRQGTLWIRFLKKLQTPSTSPNAIIKLINYKASFDPTRPISYMCDSILLTTVSNNSTTGERTIRVQIINGKCQSSSWNTQYSSDRYIKIQTFKDMDPTNDIISIWGMANGVNREGRAYTVSVSQNTPLIKHSNCPFISSGVLNLTPDGLKTRTIDYSSGTNQDICDDKATITVNGITFSFNLK